MYYMLDKNDNVTQTTDIAIWGNYFEKQDRKIADTELENGRLSTVFLGLDHAFDGGPPKIFESMFFGGPLDGEMRRYSTKDEALDGHAEMLLEYKEAMMQDVIDSYLEEEYRSNRSEE